MIVGGVGGNGVVWLSGLFYVEWGVVNREEGYFLDRVV